MRMGNEFFVAFSKGKKFIFLTKTVWESEVERMKEINERIDGWMNALSIFFLCIKQHNRNSKYLCSRTKCKHLHFPISQ